MPSRFNEGALSSFKARLAELACRGLIALGVKNRLNFLGVTEGFRRSLLPLVWETGDSFETWESVSCKDCCSGSFDSADVLEVDEVML